MLYLLRKIIAEGSPMPRDTSGKAPFSSVEEMDAAMDEKARKFLASRRADGNLGTPMTPEQMKKYDERLDDLATQLLRTRGFEHLAPKPAAHENSSEPH